METMKRSITFKDAENNKVVFDAEITRRNGYFEFTASGQYCDSAGQCFDEVRPDGENQTKLINFWEKYHLNGMDDLPINFDEKLNDLMNSIEGEEEEKQDRKINEDDFDLFEEFSERETAHAIALMLELSVNEINDIEEQSNYHWTVQGTSYLAGTDDEMDEVWDEYLESFIDDCLEIPEDIERYFDREAWKEDARIDGRGHSLNSWDGGEEEYNLSGTYYFLYRN